MLKKTSEMLILLNEPNSLIEILCFYQNPLWQAEKKYMFCYSLKY